MWPYRSSHRLCSRSEVLSSSSSAASEGISRFRSSYADCDSELEEEASAGGVLRGSLEAMFDYRRCQADCFKPCSSCSDVFDD